MGKFPRIQFTLRVPKDSLFLLGTEILTGHGFRVQGQLCKFTNSQKGCVFTKLWPQRENKGSETLRTV